MRRAGDTRGQPRLCRAAPRPPAWPELLLLCLAGTVPAPAKGTGTEMGTRWAGGSPELWRGDRDLRHDGSRAVPCRAVPCWVPTPVPLLISRPRPHRASALSPWRGRRRGDRGTLVLCHCGAPPAPSLNVALVPHRPRVSPVTFAPGPGCPQQEEGDKPGHTSAARGPWEPWLCPQLPESGPQTPSPPPAGAGPANGHVPRNTSGGHGHASRLFWGG